MTEARTRLKRGAFRVCCAGLAIACSLTAAANAFVTPRLKPPAPGPAFVSDVELQHLKEVEGALSRREWGRALAAIELISDPVAQSLGQWLYFYAEDPQVDIAGAARFLSAHPDWPALSRIQMHVEKRRLTNATSPVVILNFFDARDPVSGEGKLQLGRAQIAAGKREAGEIHIREAWVNHDFTLQTEQQLLASYAHLLAEEDHIARVDRLLWSRQVTAARRVFSRLPARERRLAEARAALLLDAANAPALYNALSDSDRADSGVLHAAVRYYRRAKQEPRAIQIARLAPTDPGELRNGARWWEERQLLMRYALTERLHADAYAMAAGHGLEPGAQFAEAEFYAGWIALRFLGAPERAETHFRALNNTVTAPISVARGEYWLGRTADALNRPEDARNRYARAAQYIYTYYGQLAAERIGGLVLAQQFAPIRDATPEERSRFASRPAAAAMRILSDMKHDHALMVFAYHVDDYLQSAGEYVELANVVARRGATHLAVRAGKAGIARGHFAPDVAYPVITIPDEAARFAPKEIILGLSRQESEFNPRALSSAGARGVMQLIPATAEITARKERMRYSRAALLDDPHYNVVLGSAHLSHLMERYQGSLIMTFVAYNAGPNRVEQWIGRYGDPRAGDVDPVDWIEQIPFAETRNYVQRVLENAQIYRARLNESPIAGRLIADIEIGGPANRAGRVASAVEKTSLPPLPARTLRYAALEPAPAAPELVAPVGAGAAASRAAPVNRLPPASRRGAVSRSGPDVARTHEDIAASELNARALEESRQEFSPHPQETTIDAERRIAECPAHPGGDDSSSERDMTDEYEESASPDFDSDLPTC